MSKEIENNEEEVFEEEAFEEEEESEDTDTLKTELEAKEQKIKELENLIARKKKESKVETKEEAPKTPNSELSQKDLYTLIKNDVHEDDVDEVVEYSRLKNIAITDALKSNVIKAILKDKAETRKTAQVTNTGTTRKGSTSKDVDTLVASAKRGEMPSTPEEMQKVFLRMQGLDK